MVHRVDEGFAVQNVDVQMMRALHKVAVQDGNEVVFPLRFILTQRLRHDGEGVGNAVLAHIAVRIGRG